MARPETTMLLSKLVHHDSNKSAQLKALVCKDPELYRILDDKWRCDQLLREFPARKLLELPETVLIKESEEKNVRQCRALLAECSGEEMPCFVKVAFGTSSGSGVVKVRSVCEFEDAVVKLTAKMKGEGDEEKQTLILQKGVSGEVGRFQ